MKKALLVFALFLLTFPLTGYSADAPAKPKAVPKEKAPGEKSFENAGAKYPKGGIKLRVVAVNPSKEKPQKMI